MNNTATAEEVQKALCSLLSDQIDDILETANPRVDSEQEAYAFIAAKTEAFREALECAVLDVVMDYRSRNDLCAGCGGSLDDGEGYGGYCGNCADAREED